MVGKLDEYDTAGAGAGAAEKVGAAEITAGAAELVAAWCGYLCRRSISH